MLVSTKGDYALRVLIDLAEHQAEGFIPLKVIAKRQDISEKYLESIIKPLVKAGLLDGLRGKGGGYRLAMPPEQYTIGMILRLTEESMALVPCRREGSRTCSQVAECRLLPLWQDLSKRINEYFDCVTIADLMKKGGAGNDYVI